MVDKPSKQERLKKEDEKQIFRLTPNQAIEVAKHHLKRFSLAEEWNDAAPSDQFPLYSPKNKEIISFYEIKISSPKRGDAGYVIVSANEANAPIVCFSMNGKTNTEWLLLKCADKLDKVIWHGPTYVTGEDQKGNVIGSVGSPPDSNEKSGPEIVGKTKALHKNAKTTKLKRTELEKEHQKDIRFLWRVFKKYLGVEMSPEKKESKSYKDGGAYKTAGVDIEEANFIIRYADGCWKQPVVRQLQPSPPNNTNHRSGCGATAWVALVSFHDMHWDPDLLYGTHDANDDYTERLTMIFHDKLGTTGTSGGGGMVDNADMEKGYQVIKQYLLHGQGVNLEWYAYDKKYQTIYDYVHQMIFENRHPCIVNIETTNGHFALGYAIAVGETVVVPPLGFFTDYFVQVNKLDGLAYPPWIDNACSNWVHGSYIKGAWSFHRDAYNCPRKKIDAAKTSPYSMSMKSLNNELYNIFVSNGKIHICKAEAANYPIPERNPPEGPKPIAFTKEMLLPPNRYHITTSDLLTLLTTTPASTPAISPPVILPINATPSGSVSISAWNYEKPAELANPFEDLVELLQEGEETLWEKFQRIRKLIEEHRKGGGERSDLIASEYKSKRSYSKKMSRTTNGKGSKPRFFEASSSPTPKEILEFSRRLPKDIQVELKGNPTRTSAIASLGEMTLNIFAQTFKVQSGPHLFMCWKGPVDSGRIHLSVLEMPKDLDFNSVLNAQGELKRDALNFAHVVLPERFYSVVDPAIAIAQPPDCDPMLYIFYATDAFPNPTTLGFILCIKLATFFEIARDGTDLWPREWSDPSGLPGLLIQGSLEGLAEPSKFDWFWCPFAFSVSHLDADSDGQKVSLIWTRTLLEKGTRLYGKQSYSFAGQPRSDSPRFVHWGEESNFLKASDCGKIGMFYDSINDDGVYVGFHPLIGSRPSVCAANNLISWTDNTRRIFVGNMGVRTDGGGNFSHITNIKDLLETTYLGPSLHYVTDKLGNKNVVLGWFGTGPQRSMNHRLLYTSPPISMFDDLPK